MITRYKGSDSWPPFIVPWDDCKETITDMSHLLHKPAGKYGYVHVRNGRLHVGDQRFRIWGQNMTLGAPMPECQDAPVMARRMAKYGINCIRLHHIDHRWPDGVLCRHSTGTIAPLGRDMGVPNDGRREPTRSLDPEALVRLDWFIYRCMQEGIYIDLNLHVSRLFTEEDGVRDAALLGFAKATAYFNRDLIRLQKEYARQILTHVNPFTGNDYAHEPAVALIELLNENSLTGFWMNDKLHCPATMGETWGNIPASYIKELDELYNRYLLGKYDDREKLLLAWGDELLHDEDPTERTVRRTVCSIAVSRSSQRFIDEAMFYQSIEIGYFDEMSRYLKEELGTSQLIVGTADNFLDCGGLVLSRALSTCDVVDAHGYYNSYWDTPDLKRNQRTAAEWYKDWFLKDKAMIENPKTSLPAMISRSVVGGHPFIVSEINEHFPGEYACECIPVNTAYALLQDWDGIFWFGYAGGDWEGIFHFDAYMSPQSKIVKTQAITRFEWMCNDPVKMMQMAMCGLMFHRGDLDAAIRTVKRYHTATDMYAGASKINPDNGYFGPDGISPLTALIHRIEIKEFNAERTYFEDANEILERQTYESDTGQIRWTLGNEAVVTVSAPSHIISVGFDLEIDNSRFALNTNLDFASFHAASIDGQPLEASESILILACSRVANTGMQCMDDRCSLGTEFGTAPTRVQTVPFTFRMKGLDEGTKYEIQALDGTGMPLGKQRRLYVENGSLLITADMDEKTIIYHLVKDRRVK